MKLDKRYLTEIDLRGRTTTGDPEGETSSTSRSHRPRDALEESLDAPARRGRAADPGGVRGEDRRRAGLQAPPAAAWRSRCRRARCASTSSTSSRTRTASRASSCSSARGRTCGRSPTRSAAIASRSAGPRSARSASRRRTSSACCRSRRHSRAWRSPMRIAHAPTQLERRPRAVAIGTFDGVHRGHLSVLRATVDSGLDPTVITLEPHPRIALGQPRRADHDARAPPRAARGGRDRRDARRRLHARVHAAHAGRVRRDVPDVDRRGGRRRRG